MEPVFLNDWARNNWGDKKGLEALKDDFEISDVDLDGVDILLASYTYECYGGDAFVLFRKDGKYYEVNGSHCSCCGLEEQWEPEEASLEEIYHRITAGTWGDYRGSELTNRLKELLENLIKEAE